MLGLPAALVFLLGCPKPRDLADPHDRPVTHTAYTQRGVQVDGSVGGSHARDLGARLGGTVGLGKRAHVDANLAHLAFGVVNVGARVTLVETARTALAVDARVLGTSPDFMWYLPEPLRTDLSDLGIATLPLGVHATARPHDLLLLGLGVGYEHSVLGGSFNRDVLVFDGTVGARRAWARPVVHLLAGRVLFEASAFVPFAAWGTTALETTATLSPGIRAGAVSHEWAPIPALPGSALQLAAELSLGATRLRLGVTRSPVLRELGVPLVPSLGVRFRSPRPRPEAP